MTKINFFRSLVSQYFLLLSILFNTISAQKTKDQELVEKINKLRPSWVAGLNRATVPINYTKYINEKVICPKCPVIFPEGEEIRLPRFLDARNKWKATCGNVISRIRHQGQCDSSWAVAAMSMVSDRICIASGGSIAVHLSAEHVMNCCGSCLLAASYPGCQGGCPDKALLFWINKGVVTGGEVNSQEGCLPYSKNSFKGVNDDCASRCGNKNYPKSAEDDKYKGGEMYKLPQNEATIRQELFNNGPVLAKITVYDDILFYTAGVYVHIQGKVQGIQYAKIVGYGTEKGHNYWLIANSRGPKFGENGFMKILRGVNHCHVEESVLAVKVNAPAKSNERVAAVNAGEIFDSSVIKFVLAEIISFYLYLHLYI